MKNTLAKFELPEAKEHFPQLTKAQKEHERTNESFEEFISLLDSLIQNYNERFKDFEKHENCLKLTFMPHLVDIPSAPANLKLELIELSEDNIMKYLFNSKNNSLEIWKTRLITHVFIITLKKCFPVFPPLTAASQLSHI